MEPSSSHEAFLNNAGSSRITLWTRMSHPDHALHRYFALMFMSFMGFGSYFVYDLPGALQEQIIKNQNISTADLASMYSWYSWPNVVLCFFGGYLIDKVFGIRLGASVFSFIIFLGQIITSLGAYTGQLWLMLAGRFVFGMGGESLVVAQNTYAVSWFKGRELNMVFGVQLSFARIGSSVGFLALVPIYNWVGTFYEGHTRLGLTMLLASATCLVSFLSALILGHLDKRAERLQQRESVTAEEKISLRDVTSFGANFWLLCGICVLYYVAVFPYVALMALYFRRKFELSSALANTADSSVYIISAIFSPLFGYLIDSTGRNLLWIAVGTVLTIAAHLISAFTYLTPFLCTSLLGFGYSVMASALWPMVSLVIVEHQLGTAYGIMQAVQNFGLGVSAWAAGFIVDYWGYMILENIFLISLSSEYFLNIQVYNFVSNF